MLSNVSSFLRGVERTCGEETIRTMLRYNLAYGFTARIRALGLRSGVPERAACVPLGEVLADFDPVAARQALNPRDLLLPSSLRPEVLPRCRSLLDRTHTEYVHRNVAAGLQDLVEREHVATHRGVPIVASAFAVEKDALEDRAISAALGINALLDESKMVRPRFGHLPRLRTVRARPGLVIRATKRDARHYYHVLAPGPRWRKYLAHPPVRSAGRMLWPRHRSAPMGFAPSAGWAQRVTDRPAQRAGQVRRIRDRSGSCELASPCSRRQGNPVPPRSVQGARWLL